MESRKYFGCRIYQRVDNETVPFFVFHSRIKDVYKWAGIRRIEELPDGTQRVLKETRARSITHFLTSSPMNTIPNSLLVAFEPGVAHFTSLQETIENCIDDTELNNGCEDQSNWGILEFSFTPDAPEHERPGLVVDGQHQLHGMHEFQDEDLPVVIISLLEASKQEQAFQFIVVNNKLVRVPPDNVKAIIAEFDEAKLQERLLNARIRFGNTSPTLLDVDDSRDSPFQHLLDWPHNRKGSRLVPLTAIEQSLRYLRKMFDFFEEDEDSQMQIFLAIWRAVKAKYPTLWGKEATLMRKVSINAFNEFIIDRIKEAWRFGLVDVYDPEDVEKKVLQMIKIPQEFWESEWSIKIQDNSNVRELIKSDLELITDNIQLNRNWSEDLELPQDN